MTAIDVLVGVGWLEPGRVDEWRQGRVDCLERVTVASLGKISAAMRSFRRWALARGLKPSETAYLARTRDRRPLRFSRSGDPDIERAYRTHWVSPELSEPKRARMTERQSRPPELVVVSPRNDFTAEEQSGSLIMQDREPVCMAGADMDHLVFCRAAMPRLPGEPGRGKATVDVRQNRSKGQTFRLAHRLQAAVERIERKTASDPRHGSPRGARPSRGVTRRWTAAMSPTA